MGNTYSPVTYSVPVSEAKEGESAVYRHPDAVNGLCTTPNSEFKTFQHLLMSVFESASDKPMFGWREQIGEGKLEDEFTWLTYGEVEERVKALGSGILNLNLTEEKAQFRDYHLRFVGIYSKNSLQWGTIDVTNIMYNFVTMPIYDTLGEEATEHMFNETETTVCFVTTGHVSGLISPMVSGKFKYLKHLVIMDPENLTEELKSDLSKISWYTMDQVMEKGRENLQPYPTVKPEFITSFSYTSGTTGKPKGAMFTHSNLLATMGGMKPVVDIKEGEGRYLSYLPLAHVLEKVIFFFIIQNHGHIGFFNGDVRKLKEDLQVLKPTLFASVPRLFNKFYDKMKAGINSLTGCKALLAKKAIETKLQNHDATGQVTHWLYDRLVFKKMKQSLGGRVEFIITGSAPLSADVKKFLKIAFCANFIEGYGQTEGLAATFVTNPIENRLDIVGGPLTQCEFKLIDVPEMKYFTTDTDEQGRLQPRGEIAVRGPNVIPGYYKNEEKTKETIDEDGWLLSGDIGMIVPEINALKIIDRRKNIFKLSQGEYIAPDKLQEVYKTIRGLADIFVYGDSTKSSLIAIINYDKEEIPEVASELGVSGSYEEICENQKIYDHMLQELNRCANENNFKGFEKIRKFWVDPVHFGDKDLLTTTFKLKRHNAKEEYLSRLNRLYEGMD